MHEGIIREEEGESEVGGGRRRRRGLKWGYVLYKNGYSNPKCIFNFTGGKKEKSFYTRERASPEIYSPMSRVEKKS